MEFHSHSSTADIDPVCGMTVKPESPHHYHYNGSKYRFCSAKCVAKFALQKRYSLPL